MGSGGSKTTTVNQSGDPEAQRRLAAVAERQIAVFEDQWDMVQEVYRPFEEQMIDANMRMIPLNEALASAQLSMETELTPLRQAAIEMGFEQAMVDLQLAAPAKEAFQKAALEGVSGEERAGIARGEVAGSFQLAREQVQREAGRLGLGAERLIDIKGELISDEAKASALAMTQAREQADRESFARLGAAAGTPLGAQALSATQQQFGQTQLGGFQLEDPTQKALAALGGASASFAASGQFAPQTITQKTSGGSSGMGSALGGIAGAALGAYFGGPAGAQVGLGAGSALGGAFG